MPQGLQIDRIIVNSIYNALRAYTVSLGYAVDTTLAPPDPTPLEYATYQSQVSVIKSTKGFEVQLYSQSSARLKGEKKTCRIVMFQSRTLPGDIGAPVHAIIAQDPNTAHKYINGFLPPKASSLIIAIHLISANTTQFYLLNQIVGFVLGQRRYLDYNSEVNGKFFIEQTSFADLDDPLEQVIEKVYYYTVPDVYIGDLDVQNDNVREIRSINIEQHVDDSPSSDNELLVTD